MPITFRPPTPIGARPKPTLSIRARLIVLALIAVVPLMIDRARLIEAHRTEYVAAASNDAVTLTRRGVDAQEELVTAVKSVVQVVARTQAAFADTPEICGKFLAGATSDAPWISGLSVIAPNGRISCSTVANRIGLNASDRPYFQDALRNRTFVVSNNAAARQRGGMILVGAAPIVNDMDEADGVIAAGFDLPWIERIAAETARRPGAMMLVLDDIGAVLAAYPEQDKWLHKSFEASPLMDAMRARIDGMVTAEGVDGVRRIFGFARIPNTNAHLAIGLDESEVLQRVAREMRTSYIQFALIGLVVLFGVWFGGEHAIVRPLRSLARVASYIGHGNLTTNTGQRRWAAEFAPLAAALDGMAKRLAEREHDLRIANAQLEHLTRLDGLSGLANRRGFDARLETEWREAASSGGALSLVMIDIDHFKSFNDHYGHVAGDMCLRTVGEALAAASGDASIVARYGGEEFALLFAGAAMESALESAEKLRAAIEVLDLTHAAAPSGHVTVSVGVASLRAQSGDSSQILIEAADAALYGAKRRGRNTVVGHAAIEMLNAG
jgi:diguanylate cyclase (GGDEF)-like protein